MTKEKFLARAEWIVTGIVSLAVLTCAFVARGHAGHSSLLVAANMFLFVDWLTMESLRILVNKLEIAQFFNTDYNKEYSKEFAVGETVRVKLPQRFLIRDGLGYDPQPINRLYTTVTLNQIFGVDFEWDSVEAALKMERGEDAIRREYIEPAMAQLANEIDSRAALWGYLHTNNYTGVLGTDPTTVAPFHNARRRLIENACPAGERGMIIPPAVSSSLGQNINNLFNPSSEISQLFKEGSLGKLAGFDWYESMNLYNHVAGSFTSQTGVTVTGANQSGSALSVTDTSTGDTLAVGDIFSIANVFNVNPVNRRTTGVLKQFVVIQALTTTAGPDTIAFQPAIIGPGSQYQNVNSLPANGAIITLWPGTTSPNGKSGMQGLALHRDAFAIVGVKLEMPKAVEMSSQTRDPETGISVRFVRAWDTVQSKMTNRFDVLLGFGDLYPDNCAVRVVSA